MVENVLFRVLSYLEIFWLETLKPSVVGTGLSDEGNTQIQLVKIVQNFIDASHHLELLVLEVTKG